MDHEEPQALGAPYDEFGTAGGEEDAWQRSRDAATNEDVTMNTRFLSLLLALVLAGTTPESSAAVSRLRVVVLNTADLNEAIIKGQQLLHFTCYSLFGTLLGPLTMVVGEDIEFFQDCNH